MRSNDRSAAVIFVVGLILFAAALGLVVVRRTPTQANNPGSLGGSPAHHVLQSPYQAQLFARGETHVETLKGAGHGIPRDLARSYFLAGYQWVSITDVNTVTLVTEYDNTGALPVPGEEMFYPFGRFLVYGVAHDETATTPADVVRWVHRSAGVVFLSRPLENPSPSADELTRLDGLDGIEVYNARLARDQPALGDASALWDQLLTAGRHVWGIAGDDTLTNTGPDSTLGRTEVDVQVADLQPVLIADALKRGASVFSTGVRILGISTDGGVISVVTTDADKITFYGRGGEVLATTQGPRGDYQVKWNEGYVRAVATRSSDGARGWTQPIFVIP